MSEFGTKQMQDLLSGAFAPWVKDLNINVTSLSGEGAMFTLPASATLVRGGGAGPQVVCGQALAAAADTASVLTLSGLNGRFRNCTTVDMTCHFMRPLMLADVDMSITALSNGRRMAVTRTEFRARDNTKIAATATCTFAYLED